MVEYGDRELYQVDQLMLKVHGNESMLDNWRGIICLIMNKNEYLATSALGESLEYLPIRTIYNPRAD